jgi:hypothetical protein
MAIKLGKRVKDSITGYEGIAVGRTSWLYGCERIGVQGDLDKDGKVPDIVWFDEDQLNIIKKPVNANKKKKTPPQGMDHPMTQRKVTPKR